MIASVCANVRTCLYIIIIVVIRLAELSKQDAGQRMSRKGKAAVELRSENGFRVAVVDHDCRVADGCDRGEVEGLPSLAQGPSSRLFSHASRTRITVGLLALLPLYSTGSTAKIGCMYTLRTFLYRTSSKSVVQSNGVELDNNKTTS